MSSDAPNLCPDVAALVAAYNAAAKLTAYDDLFVGILYGVYIVLYVTSVHVLLSPPGFTSSRPRMLWFGITTFMFVLGTTALVLQKALELQNIDFGIFYYADGGITRLMYILSDVICAWRAVVIWDRDKRVIAILLLFILGTIAAAGCEMGLGVVPPFSQFSSQSGPLYMVGPSLGTNLLSTGLIAWKAWKRRVFVKKHLAGGTGSVSVERFLALLIESGFLYCIPWILYLISAFGAIPDPGFTVIDDVLVFIAGIYPTLIIILVAVQKSPVEHYSTHSTGMEFTRKSLDKERYFLSGGERDSGGPAVDRTLLRLRSLPVFDTRTPVYALVGVSPSFYFELPVHHEAREAEHHLLHVVETVPAKFTLLRERLDDVAPNSLRLQTT
ncbi:hypothetical protein EDB89DRAFT_2242408 [Lactarius sanguifluus]|nr:hypothetical protein EDB89DRAFT_2242408 [Lactarius sanguifluus]